MPKIRFIHTADLHLDTPFKGLARIDDRLAGRLKHATFKAFENIIDACIHEKVDFLIISGDTFDSEASSLKAQIFFTRQLDRLHIPAYLICGNHDPLPTWSPFIRLPDNVHRFDSASVSSVIYEREGTGLVELSGISYDKKDIEEDLSATYIRRHPEVPFSIALLHGTSGRTDRHASYAPFAVKNLNGKGYDYWALGHIHKWEILQQAAPAIAYPGNPQGRDFGETGRRGCLLAELETGKQPVIRFMNTASITLDYMTVNVEGTESQERLLHIIQHSIDKRSDEYENHSMIFRLILKGRTAMHTMLKDPAVQDQLVTIINEQQPEGEPFCRIDSLRAETSPVADPEQLAGGNDFTGELLRLINTYREDPVLLNELVDRALANFKPTRIGHYLDKLPEDEKAEILERARWILINELTGDQT